MKNSTDSIIRLLYTEAVKIRPEDYRLWAIEQLHRVIDFDAALWATGHLERKEFHYVAQFDLDEHYAAKLAETIDINPFKQGVLGQLGKAVDMSDVYPDKSFYASALYQQLFEPYGIKRIIGVAYLNERSGLYSIISLYRRQKEIKFSQVEKEVLSHLIYHLDAAATHAYFIHLQLNQYQLEGVAAICDQQGYYYQVQDDFLNLIESHFNCHKAQNLPDELIQPRGVVQSEEETHHNGLVVSYRALGDLLLITIRQSNPIDTLTEREKEIVKWITRGLSFKEAGKKLGVASSTVSNHLYRIYNKLGITSRTQLAKLVIFSNAR